MVRAVLVACFGFWAALSGPVRAESPIYYAQDGVAIQGYDAVAYFISGQPQRGQPGFAVLWKGAIWRFVSADNLQQFESNPRAYAPQFGGYCAYSVALGHLSIGDPAAWEIVDGRLYLTNSPKVHDLWAREKQDNIALARQNWPTVLGR